MSYLRQALRTSSLFAAFAKVEDKHGAAGTDGQSVANFSSRLQQEIKALQWEVMQRRYTSRPLLRVWLPRPPSPEGIQKTPRPIGIPAVRDRVLHGAIATALTQRFEEEFEDCSFAYRQGRSVRQAVARIERYQREGFTWLVDADISACFDSIPHEPLLVMVAAIAPDTALNDVLRIILQTPVLDGNSLQPNTLGITQGSPLSPMLANLYLDDLDEAILGADFRIVRYADDFIVLAKSPERAAQALQLTADVLANLSLKLHPTKTRITSFEQGFDFLGWRFVRSVAVPIRKYVATTSHKVFSGDPSNMPPSLIRNRFMPNLPDLPDALEVALQEALDGNPDWQPAPAVSQSVQVEVVDTNRQSSEIIDHNHVELVESDTLDINIAAAKQDEQIEQNDHLPSLQRTLYLLDAACQLGCDNQRLVIRKKHAGKLSNEAHENQELLSLPIHAVDQVMLFGSVQASTAALHLCMGAGVSVAYLSKMGRFRGLASGVPVGEAASSVAMLRAQVLADSNSSFKTDMARHFVHAKLHSSLLVLKRYARRRLDVPSAQTQLQINNQMSRLKTITSVESLLGVEGSTAAAYFSTWREWLPREWHFDKRAKLPPPDPVNALLSFGYSVLYYAVAGLLQARGLDARLGLMHSEGGRHMALASDLMEGFRAVVVDAVVLNLCLNRLNPADFTITPDGCTIKPEIIKLFIHALEDKLNSPIKHPDTGESVDFRRLIDSQVLQLQRAIRAQDASLFVPLLMK